MAIGAVRSGGVMTGSMQVVNTATVHGAWFTIHDDLEQAAYSATILSTPATITDSNFHWGRVPDGASRILLRARYSIGGTAPTNPVLYLLGAYGVPATDGSFANDGAVVFMRLDAVGTAAAGFTFTLVAAGAGLMKDATYAYSDPVSLTLTNLNGANYVGVGIATAGALTGGTIQCLAMFSNQA
jgi:hypothetical protein